MIAELRRSNCLFRLHSGAVKKEEIIEFLKVHKAHWVQPLLVIWGGLRAHHSCSGAQLSGQSERTHPYRVLAAICTRHEPGRIPVCDNILWS
jgi:hypothetical protein